ncbi:MAG: alpha-helical pore-forming toxin family protein [Candidatus Thiodiazotropha sp. (ex Lucinoma aequizonata)]|nr:alpha-helical pore-forming toxin family protein [Candidatus Thiodiazotropha sp. (ex Lucinoma aequizonata)]MCU7888112.1 alpha-helical pore-forming toxin family protein [Candidatus Thiodiazotropha sp. (ex Lucinoma aequizonata)]MCU7896867.1 alpha-helical pore-forming toxin family protein [Candidatus Thiodiazotropha sp. (ex Lucinoma aequizonata)]MCU7898431.1 alpha-helical pore-forming toxin family protein [Candidatus Thiodiazotropha sp. (ex Lucinoma aequizonata)]MCU7903357.1 alpha-helical pore-f
MKERQTMNNIIKVVQDIRAGTQSQCSQALLIQLYCNSILQQPKVDFSGYKNVINGNKLIAIGEDINTALATAQQHANEYLNAIQTKIIINISNIENYYNLHKAVAVTLPSGSSNQQWITALNALKTASIKYQSEAKDVAVSLQTLHSDLSTDSASFTEQVSKLNALVKGSQGILHDMNSQLDSIQSKINGCIVGIAVSGLAIMGGVFITAVGAIVVFPAIAGVGTAVVIGGIALCAAGIGGEVASALALEKLYNTKATLLTQKAGLNAEVKLTTSIGSAYNNFNTQVKVGVTASTKMIDAWRFLSSDLAYLINDLDKGVKSAGDIRTFYLKAANSIIESGIDTEINIIKHQMTGVQSKVAPEGVHIGDFINQLAKKHAA